MKTLVVPMHGSIGVAVSPFLEQHHYDRVILVHPWSENDSAHNNAEHLREYFGDRLNRHRMQERDLHQTKFEVRAMDCSQKPLEVAEYFVCFPLPWIVFLGVDSNSILPHTPVLVFAAINPP